MNIRLQLMRQSIRERRLNYDLNTYDYIVIWLKIRGTLIKIQSFGHGREALFLFLKERSIFE